MAANLIGNFVANHQQYLIGLVLGFMLANPGTCALLFFNLLTKIPGVGYWIGTHPDEAKAWADGFDKRIDALIDKYAQDNQPPAPTGQPPAPPAP